MEEEIKEQETAGIVSKDDEAQCLREENERLRAEIERVKSLPAKERLYEHVNVSLKTIDIFIGVMLVIGILAVVIGMIK